MNEKINNRPQIQIISKSDFANSKTVKKTWNKCITEFEEFLPDEQELITLMTNAINEIYSRMNFGDFSSPHDVAMFFARVINNRLTRRSK